MEPKLKPGTRVRLISMPQDPDPIPVGTLGTVLHVHDHRDWYQVEVAWDNGRRLMLAMSDDCVEVVGGSALQDLDFNANWEPTDI